MVNWLGQILGIKPEPWMEQALCVQADPESFFPEKGHKTSRTAKRVCDQCDVRDDCLNYALEHGERHGVWGGKTERQRRGMQRPAKEPAGICRNGHNIAEVGVDCQGSCRQCRRDSSRRSDRKRRSA